MGPYCDNSFMDRYMEVKEIVEHFRYMSEEEMNMFVFDMADAMEERITMNMMRDELERDMEMMGGMEQMMGMMDMMGMSMMGMMDMKGIEGRMMELMSMEGMMMEKMKSMMMEKEMQMKEMMMMMGEKMGEMDMGGDMEFGGVFDMMEGMMMEGMMIEGMGEGMEMLGEFMGGMDMGVGALLEGMMGKDMADMFGMKMEEEEKHDCDMKEKKGAKLGGFYKKYDMEKKMEESKDKMMEEEEEKEKEMNGTMMDMMAEYGRRQLQAPMGGNMPPMGGEGDRPNMEEGVGR